MYPSVFNAVVQPALTGWILRKLRFCLQAEDEAEKLRREEELKKQQADLEEFERKMKGKKRKANKRREQVVEKTFWQKNMVVIGAVGTLAVIIGLAVIWLQL